MLRCGVHLARLPQGIDNEKGKTMTILKTMLEALVFAWALACVIFLLVVL